MVAFTRESSGVYLSTEPAVARVAFLFRDPQRNDPSFDLTATSWLALKDSGYFAFVTPSATRDWAAFATQTRGVFSGTFQAQLGWFSDDAAVEPVLIALDWSDTEPVIAQAFSLAFRQSVTLSVLPSLVGGLTVTFDDASGAFRLTDTTASGQSFQLTASPPTGGSSSYYSPSAFAALPVTGDLAATLALAFRFTADDLKQFEAGMMYFNPPPKGGLIQALGYPLFRAADAAGGELGFDVTLDVLAPLDPVRSFFRFTDALLGTNYVTANGKPVYFDSSADSVATASRLVFAGRPVQSASDIGYYYLTPAGQFGVSLGAGARVAAQGTSGAARVLCGITGTEYLDVAPGGSADRLEFVPAQPAYRIPEDADNAATPAYLNDTATTSYARVVSAAGAYISQPQSAPLFAQGGMSPATIAGDPPPSGLDVHVLDFLPIDSWTAAQTAPATPFVPYGGLAFASDSTLPQPAYVKMESNALNPKRADAYLTAPKQPGSSVIRPLHPALATDGPTQAMTPQGMIATIDGVPKSWTALQMATSAAGILAFNSMGAALTRAVQQNQIFTVISTGSDKLFGFAQSKLTIGDWTFDLSPGGLAAPDGTPPVFLMKFYPGVAIADLVDDLRLWSQPDTFNVAPFTASAAQTFLKKTIADAKAAVYPNGATAPDTDSLYYTFYQTVTDPTFSGILAVNCNMQLDALPGAIRAVLGGMKKPGIAGFRVHHVGVAINNIDPKNTALALARSATFALVDYEKAASTSGTQALALDIDYDFEVEFLRALFTNSELRRFSCQLNLTINSLFETGVKQDNSARALAAGAADPGNTITITGSYQANSIAKQGAADDGLYSFVAQGTFTYDFTDQAGQSNNKYLKKIVLTKLQFSFDDESAPTSANGVTTSRIKAHFGIWGYIEFNELNVLDIFSFKKLQFSDLGITVAFDLMLKAGAQPKTDNLALGFSPGNLRLDLGTVEKRSGSSSLLDLIPFKLKSFLYATGDGQTIDSIDYYSLASIPGLAENGITLGDKFNYALLFDLDLGSLGGLVGSLSAFKFSMLIGWQNPANGGGIAFGVQLPQVDGKLEIKIQGVLTIAIEQFTLVYATDSEPQMLVLGLQDCFIELLGTRMPPSGTVSLGLFAPTAGADQIGWIGAYKKGEDGGGGDGAGGTPSPPSLAAPSLLGPDARNAVLTELRRDGEDGGSGVFELGYVGLGQRVGPDPASPPTSYADFLTYMQDTFWEKLKKKEFAEIYHPDGRWIFVADFTLLKLIEIGVVFYDVTPFYALQISLVGGPGKGFSFEITYTKVTDTIGLYAIKIALPDSLRTFQVGVASLTLPTLSVGIYTNGNWKVDLGFPDGDDWSGSFRIQAQAGPVPVTGSGGFYIAMLSSATDPKVFKGNHATIAAFGFALRLGVGKDFVAGPLKAGVSVTFFGIIQGAAGYLTDGGDIFRTPDALSLQGQVGIIGELYGSLDFVIVKASVNVRLQASIGLVISYEPKAPGGGDGSILLYVEASVSVSVSVRINLFLFKVTISFSFRASFRFEWQLVGSSGQNLLLAAHHAARRLAAPAAVGLCPGLSAALPLLYLIEATVIFPNATNTGAPWVAVSLGVEYESAPTQNPSYDAFKPFEAVATQLTTFALIHALDLAGYDAIVTLDDDLASGKPGLLTLDSEPDLLTGWMGYTDVLGQLANFSATVAPPTGSTQATIFPMPPFLQLSTTGRTDGGSAADLSYTFESKNPVGESYLQAVDAYFNQLFVNQTPTPPTLRGAADTATPLTTEIFVDYFKGLVRATVHQLLVTMQDQGLAQAPLTTLFRAVAGAPTPQSPSLFQQVAGQMSSSMRSGIRLPYTAGLTVPGGAAATTTNPLFSLLWQQFPVGGFAAGDAYTIALTNPDATQGWIKPAASYTLTKSTIQAYDGLTAAAVTQPGNPQPIDFTETGAQSFAFQSRIVVDDASSLQPFPPSLSRLQLAEAGAPVAMLIKSRAADGAYLPDGTTLPGADVALVTSVALTVRQVPGAAPGTMLEDVFALSGASQADEALLGRIIADLHDSERPIASFDILHQSAADVPGLQSGQMDPATTFVLRTNTTSVSQPPTTMAATARASSDAVSVGATAQVDSDGGLGFLQIVQQATVTNAAGYYLRYLDTGGRSLPAALFVKGVGQVTLLVRYTASQPNTPAAPLTVQPYHNAAMLARTEANLVYYAETTDPALRVRYAATAPGTFGVTLSRSDSVTDLVATARVAATAAVAEAAPIDRDAAIAALQAAGINDETELHAELAAMGAAPAALNALYSLVAYQVAASVGFVASNLSAPVQPQRESDAQTTSDYRIIAPLYSVATANVGQPHADRYAGIGQAFTLDILTNDAFGNQLPVPLTYGDTNLYFDPILPVDQWTGVIARYDFAGAGANGVTLSLTPTQSAFADMSATDVQAALAHFLTIRDQITGPGISFYVETSLALDSDGNLVQFTLGAADAARITALVTGMIAWLTDRTKAFPAAVVLTLAVSGTGELPPVFPLAVLFGIQRDAALISPHLKDGSTILLPAAQNVATTLAPATGDTGNLSAFAASFVANFPARKLAVGLTGTDAAQPPALASSTRRLSAALRAQRLATDGSSGGTGSGGQTLWAVQKTMLDITIGQTAGSGPRFLSPKPLDNALKSATVPLPTLPATLPQLPTQRQFVDVDLDQYNRLFFETVDTVLGPASAAHAFEVAPAAYDGIARGRESLAVDYAQKEVDWLFADASPFTGSKAQAATAIEVFAQQMRAALSSAYSVDTIVQYDVAWNAPLSSTVDGTLELFGQVEAFMLGSYAWSGTVLTATSPSAKSLSIGDQVLMLFTADTGTAAPRDDIYTVTGTSGGTQFTITVANGTGTGSFSATRQNAGLSTAHVPIVSSGTSPLTFLYGTPDIAERAVVSMELRFNVTNLQYFLGSAGVAGEARPSLWLQLIDPYAAGAMPPIGPAGTTTDIPVVFRQYPTPPTLVRQGWSPAPTPTDATHIASHAQWNYDYAYQAFLAAQDRINSTVTYNTDLKAAGSNVQLRADTPQRFTLFEALARANALIEAIRPVLQVPTDAGWKQAVEALAASVGEVVDNTDWNPPAPTDDGRVSAAGLLALKHVTDRYVVTDSADKEPNDPTATQTITLAWPAAQGQSSYPAVQLALTALDPAAMLAPYPNQSSTTSAASLVVTVPDAPLAPLGVVQQVTVQALNVLAAENAVASVQVERNLITLAAPDRSTWDVVPTFVYKTAQVRPSQPVTPFIDVATPIDVARLPTLGSGAACASASAASLCQRIYTLMANLLADPDQAAALHGAWRAAGTAPDAVRRVKIGCSFRFPMPAVSGTAYDQSSISPLVPIVLARSFDIDGQDSAQLGDFAVLFAAAIDQWAHDNAVIYGSAATPPGAQLVFDTTLYAALSGVDTPVLRFTSLTLALTDIDPV